MGTSTARPTPSSAAAASWWRSTPRSRTWRPPSSSATRRSKLAGGEKEILESDVQLVVSAAIPDERAPARDPRDAARQGLHVRQAGHHVARAARRGPPRAGADHAASTRSCTASASRTARRSRPASSCKAGAIGRVVQTVGLGPHRISLNTRPEWFWDRARYGGILCDIASHQADQFLYFTGSTRAEVVAVAGRQRPSQGSPEVRGLRRHGAAGRRRHRLHPRRLVHARRPRRPGATDA